MSNLLISFIGAIGFGGWVYSKTQRKTGGNTSNSLIVAAGAGLVFFIGFLLFINFVSKITGQ